MDTAKAGPQLAQFEAESQRYFRRSFFAGLVHGVFMQTAAAFGSIHTVLPAFVALLTPSTVAVGLMAAVEAWSYPLLLGGGAGLMAVAVALGLRLLDPRHSAQGACLV